MKQNQLGKKNELFSFEGHCLLLKSFKIYEVLTSWNLWNLPRFLASLFIWNYRNFLRFLTALFSWNYGYFLRFWTTLFSWNYGFCLRLMHQKPCDWPFKLLLLKVTFAHLCAWLPMSFQVNSWPCLQTRFQVLNRLDPLHWTYSYTYSAPHIMDYFCASKSYWFWQLVFSSTNKPVSLTPSYIQHWTSMWRCIGYYSYYYIYTHKYIQKCAHTYTMHTHDAHIGIRIPCAKVKISRFFSWPRNRTASA